MRKHIGAAAVAAGASIIVIAGCGTATQNTAPKPAQHAPKAAKVTMTAQQAGAGFYNMSLLELSIQAKVDKKLAGEGITATLKSVTCFITGTQAAVCNGTYSEGTAETVNVSISKDGQTYITGS